MIVTGSPGRFWTIRVPRRDCCGAAGCGDRSSGTDDRAVGRAGDS